LEKVKCESSVRKRQRRGGSIEKRQGNITNGTEARREKSIKRKRRREKTEKEEKQKRKTQVKRKKEEDERQ
jgi:hypothetical protein